MSNNATTDPSKVLQDFAIGCDNPNAPPVGQGNGGNLGGGSAGADPDPFIFDSLLTQTQTSAAALINYSGAIGMQSNSDLTFESGADGTEGNIVVNSGSDFTGEITFNNNGFTNNGGDVDFFIGDFNIKCDNINVSGVNTTFKQDGSFTVLSSAVGLEGISLTTINGAVTIDSVPGGDTAGYVNIGAGNIFLELDADNKNINLSSTGGIELSTGVSGSVSISTPIILGDTSFVVHLASAGPVANVTIILPTSDPHVLNQIYAVSGFVRISAG